MAKPEAAARVVVRDAGQDQGWPEVIAGRARELGVLGWVRADPDGAVRVHAEGDAPAIDELVAVLRAHPAAADVEVGAVRPEGHEQFAIRGVSAGAFVVLRRASGYELRLEVDAVMRAWALPKGPSLDPAVKRFAVEAGEHAVTDAGGGESDDALVWDQGAYERGGRVPWPAAIARGHVVFVLHGEKLRGGFALQRTGSGDRPRWLLVKRRDDAARSGSDVVAERPESVLSGRVLDEPR